MSNREKALVWWNNLAMDDEMKQHYAQIYFNRHAYTLTGREIEKICVKEWWASLTVVEQMKLTEKWCTRMDSINNTYYDIYHIWDNETNPKL